MDGRHRLVKLDKEDGIAVVTIDNGPMNVLSQEVIQQLDEICETLADDLEAIVVIVTGAGERAFMAGADIKEIPSIFEMTPEEVAEENMRVKATFNKLDFLNKPTIAAINGLALGGGCELALVCDIRITEEQALFGLPEIKLGIFPDWGGTQRLPRLIGGAKAKELMFTGDPISAQQAQEIGLVNYVVPKGEALASAKKMAQSISQRSLPALQGIKEAVDKGAQLPLEDGLQLEVNLFAKVFGTEDTKEGISAFLEKRPAIFKQR